MLGERSADGVRCSNECIAIVAGLLGCCKEPFDVSVIGCQHLNDTTCVVDRSSSGASASASCELTLAEFLDAGCERPTVFSPCFAPDEIARARVAWCKLHADQLLRAPIDRDSHSAAQSIVIITNAAAIAAVHTTRRLPDGMLETTRPVSSRL